MSKESAPITDVTFEEVKRTAEIHNPERIHSVGGGGGGGAVEFGKRVSDGDNYVEQTRVAWAGGTFGSNGSSTKLPQGEYLSDGNNEDSRTFIRRIDPKTGEVYTHISESRKVAKLVGKIASKRLIAGHEEEILAERAAEERQAEKVRAESEERFARYRREEEAEIAKNAPAPRLSKEESDKAWQRTLKQLEAEQTTNH